MEKARPSVILQEGEHIMPENIIKQPRWKTFEYTQGEVNRAGKIVCSSTSTPEEKEHAIEVIDNWRATHAYPLQIFYMHLHRISKDKENTIVVQRLKRLDSILKKIERNPKMDLWRMQDLGGCRVIVSNIDQVYELSKKLRESSIRHIFKREYNYIQKPKKSGYRSLHLVYQFHSDRQDTYNNNILIEIQFRTRLMHIWATAVETMGVYIKQALKAGEGDEHIHRFFTIASSLLALRETLPVVEGTSCNESDLVSEIKQIDSIYHILARLDAIRIAIETEDKSKTGKGGYFLLKLNYDTNELVVKSYKPSEVDDANRDYTIIESSNASSVDAVLVRAESFSTLKSAYPNYFGDISEFINIINDYIK